MWCSFAEPPAVVQRWRRRGPRAPTAAIMVATAGVPGRAPGGGRSMRGSTRRPSEECTSQPAGACSAAPPLAGRPAGGSNAGQRRWRSRRRELSFCGHPLFIPIETPTKGRGGCSRTTASPMAKVAAVLRGHGLGEWAGRFVEHGVGGETIEQLDDQGRGEPLTRVSFCCTPSAF